MSNEGLQQYFNDARWAATKVDPATYHGLVVSHLWLVTSLAKRWARDTEELREVIQDGNLGLLRAARVYRPNTNLEFKGFCRWYIKNEIREGKKRRSRQGSWRGVAEDQQVEVQHLELHEDLTALESNLDQLLHLMKKLEKLTQHQQLVIERRLQGYTLKDIAAEMQCTTQAVSAAEQNGTRTLREQMK